MSKKVKVQETVKGCRQVVTAEGRDYTEAYSKLDAKMSLHIQGCQRCRDYYRQGMDGMIWSK